MRSAPPPARWQIFPRFRIEAAMDRLTRAAYEQHAAGCAAKGFDASARLLGQAGARFPNLSFAWAELPALRGIAVNSYDNVLCETVIMHLDRARIAPSVRRMLDIVKPGGVFYLSWRVPEDADQADQQKRLCRGRCCGCAGGTRCGNAVARRRSRQRVFGQEDSSFGGEEERLTRDDL